MFPFTHDLTTDIRKPCALLVALSLLWMLVVAPLALACPAKSTKRASVSAARQMFHSVTVAAPARQTCGCASCSGTVVGKCCCAKARSRAHALAFCAACDTDAHGLASFSALPPVLLPPAANRIAPVPASVSAVLLASVSSAAEKHAAFPPDAPPRFLFTSTTSSSAA